MGDIKLLSGTIGDITMKNGMFTMELRGWTQKLSTQVGSCMALTAALSCSVEERKESIRHNHWKCRLNRADWVQNGTVLSSPDLITIVPTVAGSPPAADSVQKWCGHPGTDPAPAGWFDNGVIKFTSGELEWLSVRDCNLRWRDAPTLSLRTDAVLSGSRGHIRDRAWMRQAPDTCHTKFINIINFAGEANIPGLNVIGAVSRPQVPD